MWWGIQYVKYSANTVRLTKTLVHASVYLRSDINPRQLENDGGELAGTILLPSGSVSGKRSREVLILR